MSNLNETLDTLLEVDGVMAAALVDHVSGMLLGSSGSGIDMEVAAAGNSGVLQAKLKTAEKLKLNDVIEDILITLGKAYHIIRPIADKPELFFYVVADKKNVSLALVRRAVMDAEKSLQM